MASPKLSVFLLTLFIHYVGFTVCQLEMQYHDCYTTNGKYVTNSTYEANLNHLLNSLTNNTSINYGFYNLSYGQNDDKIYALAICRPDMEPDSCRDCVDVARKDLPSQCPNSLMAIGGYDDIGFNNCMLRYANYPIFGLMENAPYFFVNSEGNISENVGAFNQTRQRLLSRLITEAADRASPNKYATGEEAITIISSLYGLVQCLPDLSQSDCKECLDDTMKLMTNCCDRRAGGRVITPSCGFRYETNRFFKPSIMGPSSSPVPSPPPNTTVPPGRPPSPGKKNRTVIIVVISAAVSSVILIIMGIGIFLRTRKSEKEEYQNVEEITLAESLQLDIGTIRNATDNFSDANKLGQGGFGIVYKGLLSDGQQVAIKRLSLNSNQGEGEFKTEVLLVAKLQHRNLVRLIGYCFDQNERILIYEFMPNASLDHFIHDPIKRENLSWEMRYKIMEGIARGLLYLHEDSRLRIIHRDLKPGNVLLDTEMNPKISDFGMARLFEREQTHGDTNRVVGTFGYMAPEYVRHGRFSTKSDVFSFGVLVLEIVTGQKRSSFGNEGETGDLLTYVWKNWNEGSTLDVLDPIMGSGSTSEMIKCIHIGLLCVQEIVSERPNMASVVNMFHGYSVTLQAPSKPRFFMESLVIPDTSSHLGNNSPSTESNERGIPTAPVSKNEASISELEPR